MSSKSFTKQTIFAGIAHMGSIICTLLSQIVVSRTFGPGGRGVYANAVALCGLLTVTIGMGHEMASAYLIASRKRTVSEAAGNSLIGLLLNTALLSVPAFLILYFRPAFVEISSNRIILLVILEVPLAWASLYVYGLVRGMGRSDLSYVQYFVKSLAWLAGLVCFCWVFSIRRLEVVFITLVMASMVNLIVGLLLVKRVHGALTFSFSRDSFKESVVYGIKHTLSRIANPMVFRPEMLIIPMLHVTESSLGLYAQGITVMDRFLALPTILTYVLVARVSAAPQKSVEMTAMLCRSVLFATFTLGLAIMVFAKPLMSFLFTSEFVPAVPMMWIMFPGIILRSVPRLLQSYFQGTGRPGRVSIVFSMSITTMIVADVVFVWIMGIGGAAVGVLLACAVEFAGFVYLFKRSTNLGLADLCVIRLSDIVFIRNSLLNSISKNRRVA